MIEGYEMIIRYFDQKHDYLKFLSELHHLFVEFKIFRRSYNDQAFFFFSFSPVWGTLWLTLAIFVQTAFLSLSILYCAIDIVQLPSSEALYWKFPHYFFNAIYDISYDAGSAHLIFWWLSWYLVCSTWSCVSTYPHGVR